MCAVCTDLSKAFDSVHHPTPLTKLQNFHMNGSLLALLTSYVTGTMQYVINNVRSSNYLVTFVFLMARSSTYCCSVFFINSTCFQFTEFPLYAADRKIFKNISMQSDCNYFHQDLNLLVPVVLNIDCI